MRKNRSTGKNESAHGRAQPDGEADRRALSCRALTESFTDGLIVLDKGYRCTYANTAAAAFLKTTPDKLIGRILWEVVAQPRYPQLHEQIVHAAEQKVFVKFEEYCDACGRWYEWRCYPGDDGLTVFFADATEHKQIEEQVARSEQHYRLLFEGDLMGVFITRPDGTFLDCNEAMVKMLGYDSREEVLRHRSSDFYVDPEFREEAVRILQKEGIYRGKEGRIWRKDGSIAHLLGAAVLLKDEETGEPYVQGVAIDITERRRAEDALRESEERYRKLFESNLAGVYLTKLDGTIIDFNDTMMRMLGYESREEVFQHHSTDFYADPEFRKELIYLLHRDGIVPGREALLQRKDGAPLYALGAAVLLTNERTGERCIQGVAVDITDRRRAEEALQQLNNRLEEEVQARTEELSNAVDRLQDEVARRVLAERQVRAHSQILEDRTGQLQRLMLELTQAEDRERKRVAEILHDDLQQVLAAAKFHLGLLDSEFRSPEESRQIAGQVRQMLKDAIEKSRSLSHELSPAVLYQSDLDDTFTWLARQIHDKYGLIVHLDIRGPVPLQSEPLRALLYKAAQELLFNVVKHARSGEAWIRLRRLGGYVCLSVSDKGRGFDPEQLQKVAGFGLLSIRERVGLLGGRMKIKSAKGKGSTFHIIVPCDKLPGKAAGVEPSAEGRGETGGRARDEGDGRLRVVLVDDHEIVRQGMALLLSEQPNIEVVGQASNGREAINLSYELRPDVVVMDVSMPLMNGDEATRQIKRHVPGTRVVALSMYDEAETIERMYEAGAESYVLKNAPSEELLAAIRGK